MFWLFLFQASNLVIYPKNYIIMWLNNIFMILHIWLLTEGATLRSRSTRKDRFSLFYTMLEQVFKNLNNCSNSEEWISRCQRITNSINGKSRFSLLLYLTLISYFTYQTKNNWENDLQGRYWIVFNINFKEITKSSKNNALFNRE